MQFKECHLRTNNSKHGFDNQYLKSICFQGVGRYTNLITPEMEKKKKKKKTEWINLRLILDWKKEKLLERDLNQ